MSKSSAAAVTCHPTELSCQQFDDHNQHDNLINQSTTSSSDILPPSPTSSSPIIASYHSKFLSLSSDSFIGTYGNQEDFYKGLDTYLGLPNPNVAQAIYNEHNNCSDSYVPFTPFPRLLTSYHPAQEYEIIVSPNFDDISSYPSVTIDSNDPLLGTSAALGGKRLLTPLEHFLNHSDAREASLLKEEIIALRLYSGPMFYKYNSILRSFAVAKNNINTSDPHTNRFVTTIHCIVSGIIKLSRIMKIPRNRRVYRGLGGMLLPEQFWIPDRHGCCGGVEFGMLSTTTDINIALDYSATEKLDRATVFEIELGQINRGASLNWVSQFPCEDEILISPLSNLEAINAGHVEPRSISRIVQGNKTQTQVDVLIIPLRLNVNLKSKTIEELIATRKSLHLHALDILIMETRRELEEKVKLSEDINVIISVFEEFRKVEISKPASYFNDNKNYRISQNEMMDLKVGIMAKESLLMAARRKLTGFGRQEYIDALSTQCEDRSELVGWVNEATLGMLLNEKESLAIEEMKSRIQTEITVIRSDFEKKSRFISKLIAFDDCLTDMVTEGRVTVAKSPRNTVNDTTGLMFRPCTQASRFEPVINQHILQFPQLEELLDKIDLLGWYGERSYTDEYRSQQLRNQTGWLLANSHPQFIENRSAVFVESLLEMHDLFQGDDDKLSQELLSTISSTIEERLLAGSDQVYLYVLHEMNCHIVFGEYLRSFQEYHVLRNLERRLKLLDMKGQTAFFHDGSQFLTIESIIINTLKFIPESKFADPCFVTRWSSVIQLIADIGMHIPWCTEFDYLSATVEPITIEKLVREKSGVEEEEQALARTIIKKLYGTTKSTLVTTCKHSMYLEQSMIDEWSWSKEMFWNYNYRSHRTSSLDYIRHSVYRALELCKIGFNLPTSTQPIIGVDDPRLGFGGFTLPSLISESNLGLLYQQLTWVPIFSPQSISIASFHWNQFLDTNVLNPIVVIITREEDYYFLAGLLWATKSSLGIQFTKHDRRFTLPHTQDDAQIVATLLRPSSFEIHTDSSHHIKYSLSIFELYDTMNSEQSKVLNLAGKNITDDHIYLLAAFFLLPTFPSRDAPQSIERLHLQSTCAIGDRISKAIVRLMQRLPNLTTIQLSSSGFVDDEFSCFMENLFDNTKITTVSIDMIEMGAISSKVLTKLFYSNTHCVTFTGINLGPVGQLHWLESLRSNAANEEGQLQQLSFIREPFYEPELFDLFLQNIMEPSRKVLTSLNFLGCELSENIAEILFFKIPVLSTLTTLNLCDNRIGDSSVELFCAILLGDNHQLRELDLSSNEISNYGAFALAGVIESSETFRKVILSTNLIEDEGINKLAESSLRYLEEFDISANKFGDAGACALANSFPNANYLRWIDISYNEIGDLGLAAIGASLRICPSILEVCAKNDAHSIPSQSTFSANCNWMKFIEAVCVCEHIQSFKLANISLSSDQACLTLSRLISSSLKTLLLSKVKWEFSPANLIPIAKVSPTLQTLQLNDVNLKSEGAILLITSIMSSEVDARLIRLELCYNMIGDAAARVLGIYLRSPAATKLQSLDLALNNIHDDGITNIAHALESSPELSYLDLSHNAFTDISCSPLSDLIQKSPSLRHLILRGCDFTAMGAQMMLTASKYKALKLPICLEIKDHK